VSPQSDTPTFNSQLDRLQEKQRAAVEREVARRGKSTAAHPDLVDLRFGDADSVNGLPPPIQPNAPGSLSSGNRASLSDYSDYDSSADEAPRASGSKGIPTSTRYSGGASGSDAGKYEHRSQKNDDQYGGNAEPGRNLLDADDDPFADPFADSKC
jgi:hypothetical protein